MSKPPSPGEKDDQGFSRRTFLKTAGVGAAATGLVGVGAQRKPPRCSGRTPCPSASR